MSEPNLDMVLARLMEGDPSEIDADVLNAWMTRYPELRDAWASLVELDGVNKSGGLPGLTDEEAAAVVQAIGGSDGYVEPQNPEGDENNDADDRTGARDDSNDGGEEISAMSTSPRDRQDAIDRLFAQTEPGEAPDTIGKPPAEDLFSLNVSQDYADDCAIKCQELILKEYGIEVSSSELVHAAVTNGWYVPGAGTPVDDVGKLLELKGLEVTTYTDANIFNLVNELAQGHRVIIAVDSGELWSSNEVIKEVSYVNPELFEDGVADHAVIVSGVDISDPANPMVVITDPGTGQVAATYPLPEFLDAWEDSGFTMYATNTSPEQFALEHIENIGELPYESFTSLYPQLAFLSAGDSMFSQVCEAFRQSVRDPLADALGDLLDSFHAAPSSAQGNEIVGLAMDSGADLADGSDQPSDDDDGDLA